MHVAQDTTRNADRKNGQVPLCFVLYSSRDVNHNPLMQFDLLIVKYHGPLASDDVIDFIRPLVVMQFGVLDFDMMDLGGHFVPFLDEAPNLPAGLCPGLDVTGISTQEVGCRDQC